MPETVHRVLRLLSRLESRPSWSGPELAERLGVTERTVRRDVERLRGLGYPVAGERGAAGGYQLGAGRRLPPLVLDDDEAVALVACLRMAALDGADEVGEAALRALGKLEQVLPARLVATVQALDRATVSLPERRPAVDWQTLSGLASAQRRQLLVRFGYRREDGVHTEREVEPARLLTQGRLWYLQGHDRTRSDWRTFRLDRISDLHVTTFRFQTREAPPVGTWLAGESVDRWPCVATVRYGVGASAAAGRLSGAHAQVLGSDQRGTLVRAGAPNWDDLAWHLAWAARDFGTELVVIEPDELRRALLGLGAQLERAGRSTG